MTWTTYVYVFVLLGGGYAWAMIINPRLQRRKAAREGALPAVATARTAVVLGPETSRLVVAAEQPVISALAQRDVATMGSYVYGLRDGHWDDRLYVCRLFEDSLDRDALTAAIKADPQSSVYHLLRGFQAHAWAWKARGHGSADGVQAKDWNRFAERMDLAEKDLLAAAQLDRADPTPYAGLIAVACHLDRGEPVAQGLLGEALRRDAECYGALASYLNLFTAPHWGGSTEQCVGFARQASAGAAPGSARPMLIVLAHYYAFHYEAAFGDRKRGDAHVADPAVQREVLASYTASIGSPHHRINRRTNELRNLAAWWFYMIRDRARCDHELAQIGEAYTDAYWQRLGPPEKQLRVVRAWVNGGKWKEVGW